MSWEIRDLMSVSPATTAWHQCLGWQKKDGSSTLEERIGWRVQPTCLSCSRWSTDMFKPKWTGRPRSYTFQRDIQESPGIPSVKEGTGPQKYVEAPSHVGQYPLIMCKEESTQTELPILLCEELRWEMLGFRPVWQGLIYLRMGIWVAFWKGPGFSILTSAKMGPDFFRRIGLLKGWCNHGSSQVLWIGGGCRHVVLLEGLAP